MIFLFISLFSFAGEPTDYDVIRMGMRNNQECPQLLNASMAASKRKDLEILDLKNRVMQLELLVLETGNKKK